MKWQNTYGGSDNDYARSVIQTNDGGYVVGGYTASIDGDVLINKGLDDAFIVRVDSIGNKLWQKSFGGSNNDRLFSITKADGNNLCVAGITNSTDGDIAKNKGSYDCWIIKVSDISTLPLSLVAFSATPDKDLVLLDWKTANESNASKFIVEHSTDDLNFKQISVLNANGNVNGNGSYQFADNYPNTNINYYRLKMIDKDGKYTYSKIVKVLFAHYLLPLIKVAPNPFKGNLSLIVDAPENSVAPLTITSIEGRLLINKKFSLTKGLNMLKLSETNRLSKGMYMLTIKMGDVVKTIAVEKE